MLFMVRPASPHDSSYVGVVEKVLAEVFVEEALDTQAMVDMAVEFLQATVARPEGFFCVAEDPRSRRRLFAPLLATSWRAERPRQPS